MAGSTFGFKLGVEGEREFKKALSDINQQFKVLGSEMNLVTSQFDKQDKSVDALSARNGVLTKEIEAQKNKVEMLRSALDNASTSFGENDKRTQAWQIQLNNAEAALNGMERELDENNKALSDAESGLDSAAKETDQFGKEVEDTGEQAEDAKGKFEGFKNAVGSVAKAAAGAMAAIGAAAVAAGKQLWDMANQTAQAGDNIDKASQKIGISAKSYQEWDYVFQRCGADVNGLQSGMKKLSGIVADAAAGSESAADKLAAVGLSIEDLNGKSQDEQLSIVIAALQEMEASAERTTAANDLLGKSAVDMAAVLNMTAEDTQALIDEAHEYGMIMSDEAVLASATFEDSLTRLQGTMGGLKNRIVGETLPAFSQIMDGFALLVSGSDGASETISAGVSALVSSISNMIPQAVSLISTMAGAILKAAPQLLQSLANGILTALPTLISVVTQLIPAVTETLLSMLPAVISAGMQIITSLVSGLAEAAPELIPAVVEAVILVCETLIENLPLLLEALEQLLMGLAEGLIEALPILIDALPGVILSVIEFVLGAIPQLIEMLISIVTALAEALPTVCQAIISAIPTIINSLINAILSNIPLIVEAGFSLLTALVGALPDIILTIVRALPEIITSVISTLTDNIPLIVQCGIDLLTSLITNLPQIILEIVSAMPEIISGIVEALSDGIGSIVEVGKNLVRGLWEGIQTLASWLWDQVSGWISDIWDGILDFFGIASPSKQMKWVGKMLVDGLAGSIDSEGDKAVDAAEGLAGDINDVMNGLAGDMQTSLPTDFSVHGGSGAHGGSGSVINIYPQSLDEATVDYLFAKFNARLGAAV